MQRTLKILLACIVIGILSGALGAYAYDSLIAGKPSKEDLIKEFYEIENAVYVSPHSLRTKMNKGIQDFILVDVRSQEEYEKEHIISAVNIPAYKDKNTPAYEEVARIVSSFKALPEGKEIIVYCYSTPCMTGRKVGKMLAEQGIYVRHLGIGWNDWKYSWTSWNHEHEWIITNSSDYISSGSLPGTPKTNLSAKSCPISGSFSC